MEAEWLLLKCKCGHAFGARRGNRATCSRCGAADNITTSAVFNDSSQLADAVARANLPAEIRDQVEKKLNQESRRRQASRERAGVDTIHRILRDATDSEGILTLESLRSKLSLEGITEPTAEQVMGMAEVQGAVQRTGQEQWKWLA